MITQHATLGSSEAGAVDRETAEVNHQTWRGSRLAWQVLPFRACRAERAEPGFQAWDNLHAVVINTERLYAHADGLGNVVALTDETQGVRRVYEDRE